MRFVSVAERELRAAARRPTTYRLRWYTAVGLFLLLLWVGLAWGGFRRTGGGSMFEGLTVVVFIYCLLVGATSAADCLSRERREGTLGLLFLTNLTSAEIIAGKLCAVLLSAAYPLLAVFPILALPVLMGGISGMQLFCTVLALLNGIFYGVAAGMLASALCVKPFPAVTLATGLVLFGGLGLAGLAAMLQEFAATKPFGDMVAIWSPLSTLLMALETRKTPGLFWVSLVGVAAVAWTWLALVTWWVARSWRDRPSRRIIARGPTVAQTRRSETRRAARKVRRERLLAINPMLWLANRSRAALTGFTLLAVAVVVLALAGLAPFFAAVVKAGAMSGVVGLMIAWIIATLALHLLAVYFAAMSAAQRLAEDRQTGSLELILSTPTTEREISRGLWLAFARRMALPAVLVVLAHGVLLWLIALVAFIESVDNLSAGSTTGRLLWDLLLGRSVAGLSQAWAITMMLRVSLLALILLLTVWVTLGWVGRWLGVRLRHPAFAPLAAIALVFAPPAIGFGVFAFALEEWGFFRLPEQRGIPLMFFFAFAFGMLHCLLASVWAASRLREDLRPLVGGGLERRPRWWLPRWRTVRRMAVATAAVAMAFALLLGGAFWYQSLRARWDWRQFQAELRQQGRTLELAAVLPPAAPAEENFAQSPAFEELLRTASGGASGNARGRLHQLARLDASPGANSDLSVWPQQKSLDLSAYAIRITQGTVTPAGSSRRAAAGAVLRALAAHEALLAEVAKESAARPRFQPATNAGMPAVLEQDTAALRAMATAQFLFEVRACARLADGNAEGAAADVLAGLRLADLARQALSVDGAQHSRTLTARALQPLWEGVSAHQWKDADLAAFQTALQRFDFLADHTNAVRRLVLAHLEQWRPVAEQGPKRVSVRQVGGFVRRSEWDWQPRAWWLDYCIQLHRAGDLLIADVDPVARKVNVVYRWSELQGLPLDHFSQQVLQPSWWGSSPMTVSGAQTAVHQALAACALERYRLARGTYPEKLEALVPEFLPELPVDCARGQPLFYQRESPDRFRLLGFGQNRQNDQGKTGTDDGLWGFPAAPTNAPAVNRPK
jgi:ABC-type transport system involved in cytochrome c biogenesis permease component